ncbi:hypothetical protein ACI6Q2_09310 [Chitinophagaceae bacterium LWZ2-11]
MKKVYFISGLGADERIFKYLDLSFCEPVFIKWIKPLAGETLRDYALRLRKDIPESSPTIVGLSLGGMLTSIMASEENNIRGVIISSNKTSKEFPPYLRVGKYVPIYKYFAIKPSLILRKVTLAVFGSSNKEQAELLMTLINDADPEFIHWAVNAILTWKSENETPKNIFHIHGTADILLPYRFVKTDYAVEGGTHVMVVTKAAEVSEILRKAVGVR